MSKSVKGVKGVLKAVKVAPSAKAQKSAFMKAYADMNETTFGELTYTANRLLVSKGGKKSYAQLFDQIAAICDDYPMDVVALASLQHAGNAFSGFIAFLELNRAK